MNHPINWGLVSNALRTYQAMGYDYVEVPWIVGETAIHTTLPPGRQPFKTTGGVLVGSAEQSFVQMMLEDHLPPGRYVAASPCFRDDQEDGLHQKTFFKVELIQVLTSMRHETDAQRYESVHNVVHKRRFLDVMVKEALSFFQTICHSVGHFEKVAPVETSEGLDLLLNGIEIGSYGCRTISSRSWIYGTGLAEPRFSMALRSEA